MRATGQADTFYIVNVEHKAFLDSHGKGVWVWQGKNVLDVGSIPMNLQWRLQPVDGQPGAYYIINAAHSKFLDSHGSDVWVWGDGRDVGQEHKVRSTVCIQIAVPAQGLSKETRCAENTDALTKS